jgi:signal transduction histidine kinase
MLRRLDSEPFESRVRIVLLGVLLASLILYGGTTFLLSQARQTMERELLQPLYETLDEMEIRGSEGRISSQGVWQKQRGLEVRQRYFLRDSSRHAVSRVWQRIPPAGRARMLAGQTATVRLEREGQFELWLARIVGEGPDAHVVTAGRLYTEYGKLVTIDRWNTGVHAAGFVLLLIAVFLLTRELTRPFRHLRRVVASAQERLKLREPPSRDQWEEVIETFNATIDKLKASEAHLHKRYLSSEEERRRLDRLNVQIIDAIPHALLAADQNGCIAQFNHAARRLPGLPAPQPGVSLAEHFSAWLPLSRQLVAPESGGEEVPREGECDVEYQGERYHYFFQILPVPDGGSLLVLDDRTRLRRLESLLARRASLAALGETAAGLAHELRNALGAIVGYARLVNRSRGAETADTAGLIEREAGDMEEMLNRFLEVARPTELQPARVVGEELVEEIVLRYEERLRSAGLQLTRAYAAATKIELDPFWFRQALCNLLENALQLVPAGGSVRVRTEPAADGWRVTVADSGPGIAPEWRERILSPFISMRPGGTGLGLALVQKVMTAHGGSIEVSDSQEGGAAFTLAFPGVLAGSATGAAGRCEASHRGRE